jgi:hypothetical protein
MLLKVLLSLSLLLNVYLLYWFINNSYTIEAHPRLKRDTFVLSQFVSSSLSKDELLLIAKSKLDNQKIKERDNDQSWDGKKFSSSVKVESITFFFNDSDELMQVDHWYKENSPLWVR